MIRRSAALDRALAMGLAGRALEEVDRAPDHIIGRAAAFLLLDDSKASFEIEQEKAGPQRAARWARALGGGGIDPIVVAAALVFGFVYIHPFEDGNGRIHRYLFHHVLARGGFNPPGIIFPVSAVILRRVNDYEAVLKSVSAPMLEHIS